MMIISWTPAASSLCAQILARFFGLRVAIARSSSRAERRRDTISSVQTSTSFDFANSPSGISRFLRQVQGQDKASAAFKKSGYGLPHFDFGLGRQHGKAYADPGLEQMPGIMNIQIGPGHKKPLFYRVVVHCEFYQFRQVIEIDVFGGVMTRAE